MKDTEFAAIKLPRCLEVRGAKVEWGGHRATVLSNCTDMFPHVFKTCLCGLIKW